MKPRFLISRGSALIPALLVVAIASALAAALASRIDSGIQYATYRRDEIAARMLGQAAIDYASSVLFDDVTNTDGIDTLNEIWATNVGALPLENGELSGEIRDAQGLFNITNLIDPSGAPSPEDIKAFNRLSRMVGINQGLGEMLAARMKGSDIESARVLSHIDELPQLVRIAPQQLSAIRPFIVALPPDSKRTKINVNTARPEVIAAYLPGVGVAAVMEAIGDKSARKAFKSIENFPLQRPGMEGIFSVASEYFVAKGVSTQGRARIITESLLYRPETSWPGPVYIRMSTP